MLSFDPQRVYEDVSLLCAPMNVKTDAIGIFRYVHGRGSMVTIGYAYDVGFSWITSISNEVMVDISRVGFLVLDVRGAAIDRVEFEIMCAAYRTMTPFIFSSESLSSLREVTPYMLRYSNEILKQNREYLRGYGVNV